MLSCKYKLEGKEWGGGGLLPANSLRTPMLTGALVGSAHSPGLFSAKFSLDLISKLYI